MKRVNNKELKKSLHKNFITLAISVLFLIFTISCFLITNYLNEKDKDNSIYLNEVIMDMANKPNVKSYLDVYALEILVAKSNTAKDLSIYIASDDKLYYLVAIDSKTHDKIKNSDLNQKPYRLYGTTVTTDQEIKRIIEEAYNLNVENEKDKLTDDNFADMYGGVYLDATITNETGDTLLIFAGITGFLSILTLIAFITNTLSTKKVLKNLTDEDLQKIEKEIDDESTIKYPKYHLMLTKNYIINTSNKLRITKYSDLIWIYEHKLKQKGITTNKSLAAMTTTGKTIYLVELSGSKKMDNILNEISTKIINTNKNILVGYTKENIEESKNILKNLNSK